MSEQRDVTALPLRWLAYDARYGTARTLAEPIRCPRVEFDCGHVAYIWPDEYGDGSAWCQACGAFQCYERCPTCGELDCDHRDAR